MDGLSLLDRALAAGLVVAAAGDRLVIRGPREAEAVARELLAHKGEVLAALRRGANPSPAAPRPAASPPVSDAEAEVVAEVCANAARLAGGPPGAPWRAEMVREWLAAAEAEYIAPQEWLRSRRRPPGARPG